MVLKRKIRAPQEYIQVGMMFLLIAALAFVFAESKLAGQIFASWIHEPALLERIQVAAAGISIPISGASIFFNVRGLCMYRSQRR